VKTGVTKKFNIVDSRMNARRPLELLIKPKPSANSLLKEDLKPKTVVKVTIDVIRRAEDG
jgi:hypothetical protein